MLNRAYNPNLVDSIEPVDMMGATYEEIVAAATAEYWVIPINENNPAFGRLYHVVDVAQSGRVHYARK
jgi:hypothetical protein